MAMRTHAKSDSRFDRIRQWIRSALFSGDDPSTNDELADHDRPNDGTTADSSGNLFQCSTCGTVYIDSEKSVCSSCEVDVEEVRSTLESSLVQR